MVEKTHTSEEINKFLDEEGHVRATVVRATSAVSEMRKIMDAGPIATILLGRSMMGSLLMASHLKKGASVGMHFKGNGAMGNFYAEGTYEGAVRAFTANPRVDLPLRDNKFDIRGAVGNGLLEVVRASHQRDSIHRGVVEIQTGEIGDDIAFYLFQSHQIPSVVALSVELNPKGDVDAAVGLLIELMPGAPENTIEKIESKLKSVRNLSQLVLNGATETDIVNEFLQGFKMVQLDYKTKVRYECRCSVDRAKRAITLLGWQEIENILSDTEDQLMLSCDFCGRKYHISKDELEELKNTTYRNTLN